MNAMLYVWVCHPNLLLLLLIPLWVCVWGIHEEKTVKKGVGKWKTLSISFVLLVLLLLFWYFSCHWCRVYVGNVLLATSRQIFWINNWWSLKMWKTVNLKRLKILITYCASWLKFVWILAWFSNKASSKNLLLWKYLIYSANFTPYS